MSIRKIQMGDHSWLGKWGNSTLHFVWQTITDVAKGYWFRGFTSFEHKTQNILLHSVKRIEKSEVSGIVTVAAFARQGLLPTLRRAHFIECPDTIRELLSKHRGDQLLDPGFEDDFQHLLDRNNMLLCPYAQHSRLRSPLERPFTKNASCSEAMLMEYILAGKKIFAQHQALSASVIEQFVLSCLLKVLGLELSFSEFCVLDDLLKSENNLEKHKALHAFFVNVLKYKIFPVGSGMEALSEAEQLSTFEKISDTILLFAAGTHTTKSLIQFFIQAMAYSRINEEIYAEWKQFVGLDKFDFHSVIFSEQLAKFVQNSDYLHACYLEIMRLFPVVPNIKRIALQDFVLDGVQIFAGDELHLNILKAHRDPKQWGPTAHLFDPSRFKGYLADNKSPVLFNFGFGSQSCIGKHLAEAESKTMAALISLLFKFAAEERESFPEVLSPPHPLSFDYNGVNLYSVYLFWTSLRRIPTKTHLANSRDDSQRHLAIPMEL